MKLRIRYFLLNYLFINVVQESNFEFEISQWQPLKYFKWKLVLCLLPEWISMKWVAIVKFCESYGIFMCVGANENSSCVQTLKFHFFFFFGPLITFNFVLQSACWASCVQKSCETPVSICHGDGFDASNCTDFDSYSLCCLLNLGFGYNLKFYTCWLRKGHELLLYVWDCCIRVANTSVLQKITAHEQDHTFYY